MTSRNGGKIISDTEKVASTFSNFFVNKINTSKIDKDKQFLVETNDAFDPVLKQLRDVALILAFLAPKNRWITTCSFFEVSLMKKL